jgi:GntR family transcriptional regulator/MocR family aminotransferase
VTYARHTQQKFRVRPMSTRAALRDFILARLADGSLIEDPGYPLARAVFATRNMVLVPVNVDTEGLQIQGAAAARLAYARPSHQFPLAAALTIERRHALLVGVGP